MNIKAIILSMQNCINCKRVLPEIKKFCEESNISYEERDAIKEGIALVKAFNIKNAPTIVLYDTKLDSRASIFTGDNIVENFIRGYQSLVQNTKIEYLEDI